MSVSATWGMFDPILCPIRNSLEVKLHHGRSIALYDNSTRKGSVASLSRVFTVHSSLFLAVALREMGTTSAMCEIVLMCELLEFS